MPRTPRTTKNAREGKAKDEVEKAERHWLQPFLDALPGCGTITGAATIVNVGRRTVYDEMARNPEFAQSVRDIQERCVELVESTLYQQALDPDKTTDRIFYLKTAKPEKYGDKLRADQIALIRQETRQAVIAEINDEIARLPIEAQQLLNTAMSRNVTPRISTP